jgi:hypothetical protein
MVEAVVADGGVAGRLRALGLRDRVVGPDLLHLRHLEGVIVPTPEEPEHLLLLVGAGVPVPVAVPGLYERGAGRVLGRAAERIPVAGRAFEVEAPADMAGEAWRKRRSVLAEEHIGETLHSTLC